MSNRAKTSVENLVELIRLKNKEVYADLFDEIQKIKAMHREEIDDAYWLGYGDHQTLDIHDLDEVFDYIFGGNNEQ